MNKKRYFITGGGTGGHIYPAIAVADALLDEQDTEKIFYVGNPNNLEADITKEKDYTFTAGESSTEIVKAYIEKQISMKDYDEEKLKDLAKGLIAWRRFKKE